MRCLYLDASVVLRCVFRQPGFVDLRLWETAGASALTRGECLRTLDRARLEQRLEASELEHRRGILVDVLARVREMEVTPAILLRASAAMPSPLGTLDAIHLVSALQWREWHDEPLRLATHDQALARAARLQGLEVVPAA